MLVVRGWSHRFGSHSSILELQVYHGPSFRYRMQGPALSFCGSARPTLRTGTGARKKGASPHTGGRHDCRHI
jgi:hypothetical protein